MHDQKSFVITDFVASSDLSSLASCSAQSIMRFWNQPSKYIPKDPLKWSIILILSKSFLEIAEKNLLNAL